MNSFYFLVGVILGVLLSIILIAIVTFIISSSGFFMLKQYSDEDGVEDGIYTINIRLKPNQPLLKKKYIILRKENS